MNYKYNLLMKTIKLFHSYNYVSDKIVLKENNIYDKYGNIIIYLLNIPEYK